MGSELGSRSKFTKAGCFQSTREGGSSKVLRRRAAGRWTATCARARARAQSDHADRRSESRLSGGSPLHCPPAAVQRTSAAAACYPESPALSAVESTPAGMPAVSLPGSPAASAGAVAQLALAPCPPSETEPAAAEPRFPGSLRTRRVQAGAAAPCSRRTECRRPQFLPPRTRWHRTALRLV